MDDITNHPSYINAINNYRGMLMSAATGILSGSDRIGTPAAAVKAARELINLVEGCDVPNNITEAAIRKTEQDIAQQAKWEAISREVGNSHEEDVGVAAPEAVQG